MRNLFVPTIILTLMIGTAISTSKKQAKPANIISKTHLEKLETLATQACLCKFIGGNTAVCEKEYRKAVTNVVLDGFDTSSYPISGNGVCLRSGSPNCFALSFEIVGQNAFVCTNAQADRLEKVWLDTQGGRTGSTEKADKALMADLEKMRKDEIKKAAAAAATQSN